MANLLGTFGLLVNLAGIVLLFYFGFPQPSFRETTGIALNDATVLSDGKSVKERGDEKRRKKKIYKKWSGFALFLIITGTFLQAISLWVK